MVLTRTQHARTPVAAQSRGAHTQPSIPTRCASLLTASLSCQSFSFCSSPKKSVFLGRLGKSFEKEKEETMKRKKRGISAVAKVQGLREHYHPSGPHSIFLSACHVPARGAEASGVQKLSATPGKRATQERKETWKETSMGESAKGVAAQQKGYVRQTWPSGASCFARGRK